MTEQILKKEEKKTKPKHPGAKISLKFPSGKMACLFQENNILGKDAPSFPLFITIYSAKDGTSLQSSEFYFILYLRRKIRHETSIYKRRNHQQTNVSVPLGRL